MISAASSSSAFPFTSGRWAGVEGEIKSEEEMSWAVKRNKVKQFQERAVEEPIWVLKSPHLTYKVHV